MNVLEGLPERIRRYPDLYVLRGDSAAGAAARIAQVHERDLDRQSMTYNRTRRQPGPAQSARHLRPPGRT